MYMCNINTDHNSFAQFMSFDIPRFEAKIKNTLTIILGSYIACTWYNRDRLEVIGYILKAKIIRDQKLNMKILGDKAVTLFTENYCKDNIEFISRL